MELRRQLAGIGSLLPCGSQERNSGGQFPQHASLFAEPYQQGQARTFLFKTALQTSLLRNTDASKMWGKSENDGGRFSSALS